MSQRRFLLLNAVAAALRHCTHSCGAKPCRQPRYSTRVTRCARFIAQLNLVDLSFPSRRIRATVGSHSPRHSSGSDSAEGSSCGCVPRIGRRARRTRESAPHARTPPARSGRSYSMPVLTNGICCGEKRGYKDPRAASLRPGAADWMLLLHVDSDDALGWMWGNAGRLSFWIRKQTGVTSQPSQLPTAPASAPRAD
jgi:hypothetical protein